MKKIIIIFILISAVSCVRYDIDEILLPREDISLTVRGVEQFSYDPLTCQMSQNTAKHEFRVFDDRLSGWFVIRCKERPSGEGQELTADLSWTGKTSTKALKDLTFRIEKIDPEGKIWMWCKQKSIGIVIKNL